MSELIPWIGEFPAPWELWLNNKRGMIYLLVGECSAVSLIDMSTMFQVDMTFDQSQEFIELAQISSPMCSSGEARRIRGTLFVRP